ncbi:MAG: hypothetical protein LBJ00_14565 [Planctomycetaceae bacterium]|nr:hypothetical protein [Planctomycetaceae bacterium]
MLLPEVSDSNKLSYGVNLVSSCLISFVIGLQSLQDNLMNRIIIYDTKIKSKLILSKKNKSRKRLPYKENREDFSSIVDFDPEDLSIVEVQMSSNDLSILIYLFLEKILQTKNYEFDHFDQQCENIQGTYGQCIYWNSSE